MKLVTLIKPVLISTAIIFSLSSTASLVPMDLDGDFVNGHEGVYDTVLKITWLADANLAATELFELPEQPGGKMNWLESEAYIEAMNTAVNIDGSVGYLGVINWRQTTASDVCQGYGVGTTGDGCGNAPIDTLDEMGYHYYQNFGALKTAAGGPMTSGANTANVALFQNVQASYYWTETLRDNLSAQAWLFSANIGWQTFGLLPANDYYVWAVTDGMVGTAVANPVPVPAAAWLFGTALLGLSVVRKENRAQLNVKLK